ncbi:glutaminyl-peptide cyclotransferase [Sunxiuqinia sp. A32]|uniref:glutaminyl-peptide cyclotransferase n=1 Tax=Sunxiuqinia sp. A32 TaxID=3461496 RepID=UPI004045EAD8
MKLKIFTILIVSSVLVGFLSCSNKPKRSRKPVAQIVIQPRKTNFIFGDSINISVSVKLKDGELAYAKLYLDNQLLKESSDLDFNASIPKLNELGSHQLKVLSTKSDSVQGINYMSFNVLSDIVPDEYGYEVVKTFPHSTEHYTQGLEIYNGKFYESTGENERSGIYEFDLNTGNVKREIKLEDQYFGEGITILNDKIYQITYRAQKGFIYDLETFSRIDSFTFETEQGWGLTHNNQYIIKTDGTEFIHFLDTATLNVVKKIQVFDNRGPVKFLNELEFHDGVIYANIYTTDYAVKIDPNTGKVLGRINFRGLLPVLIDQEKRIDVLNGIAINPNNDKMYITGKLWPKLFEVKLIKIN